MRKKINFKMIRNVLLFIILIVLTYWLIFREQDMNQLMDLIRSSDKTFIILGILSMFCYFCMEAYNVKSLLKVFGDKISFISALKFTWIGFFFSSITPAASGGQPIEIYYMTKEKISGANATLVLLIQLCGFQISTIFLGILCAILCPSIISNGLIWLYLLGLTINGIALSLMLIGVFSKKITKKLINIFIKLLKIAKIKQIDEKKKRIEEGLDTYNESAVFIKNNKNEFIKAILRVFVQVCFYYTVPFLVYKSFGFNTYNYFQIFAMQSVLYTTVSSLPLPGAIGISETVFLAIFKPAFGDALSGAMLLSRGITFYLYVIISLFVVIINAVKMKNVLGEIDNKVRKIEGKDNLVNA